MSQIPYMVQHQILNTLKDVATHHYTPEMGLELICNVADVEVLVAPKPTESDAPHSRLRQISLPQRLSAKWTHPRTMPERLQKSSHI
jgi:hypothetical protein